VPKAKLEMDESLTDREHQGARDEALASMKNMTLLTSAACVRQLMGAAVELIEMWLEI
jgi:hypothetical protein